MDLNYKKPIQKDYSLSLKLQIIQEIEQGLLTTTGALSKYGVQAASIFRTWLKNMVTLIIYIQFKKGCQKLQSNMF